MCRNAVTSQTNPLSKLFDFRPGRIRNKNKDTKHILQFYMQTLFVDTFKLLIQFIASSSQCCHLFEIPP